MITAYLIRSSYRGIDDPPTSLHYVERDAAERRVNAANSYNKHSPDHREHRVEAVEIDAMWIRVALPYANLDGIIRNRRVEVKARGLVETNGVITGEIDYHDVKTPVEYSRLTKKWRTVDKLRLVRKI